ncbi:TPA: type II secretion protein E, partial [Escherichia coli]
MPETIELPPEDIRDFVAIQHDADGKIRVKVVEAKKHITSVQRYLTLLRSRYPGKISKFDFTTLDVIATLNSNNTERAPGVLSDGGINTVQRKVLDYIRKAAQLDASDLHITPGRDNTDFTYVEARVHGELEVL